MSTGVVYLKLKLKTDNYFTYSQFARTDCIPHWKFSNYQIYILNVLTTECCSSVTPFLYISLISPTSLQQYLRNAKKNII